MGKFLSTVDVLNQIESNTKIFTNNQVQICVDLERIIDELNPVNLPYAVIVNKSGDFESVSSLNSYTGILETEISVFVVLDTNKDLTGAKAQITTTDVRIDLSSCLGGWVPSTNATTPMMGPSWDFAYMSGSRVIYEYKFSITEQVNPEDGYCEEYDDLTEIDITGEYYKNDKLISEQEVIITK
ncbi:hypothetical protein [Novacetimonas hansenii]|uniref:Uncharacterized protein n=1 Tax=Novacetimonas hansenii TaxID=436 RepID=A0ABQ0SGV7_NOVHA|nr:hypothetical protein [Novacetimonas hansenii]GAN84039.1 hypothetical protein Gaha_0122_039 [Novacetimonas hansenii JCM 7643]GBQ55848.1 hypothetical protein AA0243_1027 [Novacetimonas hansenii NRIC 0243]GEC64619.1 hypothetical protein GHA01_24680 [Novacetimonas hansenii]